MVRILELLDMAVVEPVDLLIHKQDILEVLVEEVYVLSNIMYMSKVMFL